MRWVLDHDARTPKSVNRKRLTHLVKDVLKRSLPERLISEIRAYRKNPPDQRRTYIRLRLANGSSFKRMARLRVPRTARSLLFVCFGNIIRSPMCEALARQSLAEQKRSDIIVTSAGTHAIPGRQAHPYAISTASQMGIDLSHHNARALNAEMVEQADAILAMDCRNVVELVSQFPRARNKIYMLGAYAENHGKFVEIEDPYYGHEEMTRECYKRLKSCIERLMSSLRSPKAA
jgi:protein-tyrosine phosphatase